MPPLMQMPAYRIDNTELQTEPVVNALMQNRAYGLKQEQMGLERERTGMDRERLNMTRQQHDEERQAREVQRIGKEAEAIHGLKGPQRQAVWQRWTSRNPQVAQEMAKFGIDPNDHMMGPEFLAREASGYDPMKRRLQEAQIANLNRREEPDIVRTMRAGGIDPRSPEGQQIIRSTIKGQSPVDQARANILNELMPGGGDRTAQAQPQPRVIPQSYDGGSDPNLIQIQAPGEQAQPQRRPGVFDSLTPEQRTGVALGIAGFGDAGKIVAESANSGRFGKEGANHIDKALIDRAMDLGDLNQIKSAFRPEYLGLEGQAKALGANWSDWLSGGKIDPQSKQFLSGYTQFSTATTERLNNRIKALSGAAVSESEAKRMYAANPTTGDGPTTFASKLDQQIDMNRMAVARYNWLKNQYKGTPEQIADLAKSGKIETLAGLDDMKRIYSERSSQIEQQLKIQNPQAKPEQINQARRKMLQGEFGI